MTVCVQGTLNGPFLVGYSSGYFRWAFAVNFFPEYLWWAFMVGDFW